MGYFIHSLSFTFSTLTISVSFIRERESLLCFSSFFCCWLLFLCVYTKVEWYRASMNAMYISVCVFFCLPFISFFQKHQFAFAVLLNRWRHLFSFEWKEEKKNLSRFRLLASVARYVASCLLPFKWKIYHSLHLFDSIRRFFSLSIDVEYAAYDFRLKYFKSILFILFFSFRCLIFFFMQNNRESTFESHLSALQHTVLLISGSFGELSGSALFYYLLSCCICICSDEREKRRTTKKISIKLLVCFSTKPEQTAGIEEEKKTESQNWQMEQTCLPKRNEKPWKLWNEWMIHFNYYLNNDKHNNKWTTRRQQQQPMLLIICRTSENEKKKKRNG